MKIIFKMLGWGKNNIIRPLRQIFWTTRIKVLPGVLCAIGRQLGVAVKEQPIIQNRGEFQRTIRRHIDLVHFIRSSNIPLDRSVLDVGCGPGGVSERLYEAGFRCLSACDWLPEVELQSSVRSKFTYSQVDLNVNGLSSYSDRTFDLIVCSDVIEHLENPAKTLRELERILAPRGHIFMTLPNAFNIFQRLHILRIGNSSRYRSERISPPFSHISMLPSWVLESLCDRAGLEIVEEGKGYCWWKDHFWFLNHRMSHLFSYVTYYHLMRKVDLDRIDVH